jgi:hypothetical protein
MSLEAEAPVVESAPAAAVEAPEPSNEPISTSDLAGLFKAELDAESGPEQKPAAPVEVAAPDTESAPEQAEPAEADQPETSDEDLSPAALKLPGRVSEADQAMFAALPPEQQQWLAKREQGREADYTRKTQEVAEQRKLIEGGQVALLERLQAYDAILSNFTQRPLAPPDPALRQTDPLGFDDQMAAYVQAKHNQEIAQAEQAKVRAEHGEIMKYAQQQHWQEQGKRLGELAPELAARTTEGAKLRQGVYEYGLKHGYSKDQLNNATASDLVTLWKAQRYDAMAANKSAVKPVTPAPPKVMQPGQAKVAAGRNGSFSRAVQDLSSNPSRAALAAAYRAELAAER